VGLIPFDEARQRLRVSGQTYLGVQEIPIERIVGSVDRSADFDRGFRPRRGLSRSRLASLRSAFGDEGMPAIEVFEVGGAYFVEDGHHRVALARERRADFIDAEVTRLQTNYEVGPGVDVRDRLWPRPRSRAARVVAGALRLVALHRRGPLPLGLPAPS
jgi:hypothetical protein